MVEVEGRIEPTDDLDHTQPVAVSEWDDGDAQVRGDPVGHDTVAVWREASTRSGGKPQLDKQDRRQGQAERGRPSVAADVLLSDSAAERRVRALA